MTPTTETTLTEKRILETLLADSSRIGKIISQNYEKLKEVLPQILPIDLQTGLLNKCYFEREILPEIVKKSSLEQKPFFYIVYDINDLGKINQDYGRSIGGFVVGNVAKEIKSYFNHHLPGSFIGRIDYGDEFAIATFGREGANSLIQMNKIAEQGISTISKIAKESLKNKYHICLKGGMIEVKVPQLISDVEIGRYVKHIANSAEETIERARNNNSLMLEIGYFVQRPGI